MNTRKYNGFYVGHNLINLMVILIFMLLFSCTRDEQVNPTPFVFNPVDEAEEEVVLPDVIISEVAAVNEKIKDRDNEDPDWIELYNRSSDTVNLGDYYLSDDEDLLTRWRIPDTLIPPGEYLLIMASGKDYRTAEPGGDTTGGITRYIWGWADGDLPNGGSTISPYETSPGVRGVLDGDTVISATYTLAPNEELGWRSTTIHMGWIGRDSTEIVDMSGYDKLLYKGYIEKDKKLLIRVTQQNVVSHQSYGYELIGTGNANDTYTIPLDKKSFLDLSLFYGIQMANPPTFVGSVSFTCRGFYFITCEKFFHTNFSLNGNEILFLSDSTGTLIDSIHMQDLKAGLSLCRNSADSLSVSLTDQPTPGGQNNTQAYNGQTPSPQIVPDGGVYDSPVSVRIASVAEGIVRYTLDGSTPDTSSPAYTAPFSLDETAVVRARAFKDGQYASTIATSSFFVGEQSDMAVISLTTDSSWLFDPDTGIYMKGNNAAGTFPYFGANFWEEKEVPVSVEMFGEDKQKLFAHDAGLRIFGNWSRGNDQKSLSVHFRGMYGTSVLEESLFPEFPHLNRFKNFILRNNGSNCGKTEFRDVLMCSLLKDRDIDFQKYRPVVVYINGRYWGIYNMREKLNEDYVWTNYGIEEGNFDLLKGFGEITSGSRVVYDALENYMRNSDMSSDSAYHYVSSQIDIVNYQTYMAAEMFYGNTDWPANNIKFWKSYDPDARWRWILYDTDFGFQGIEDIDVNMFEFCTNDVGEEYPNGPAATFLFRTLLESPQFTADFIAVTSTLLNTNFKIDRMVDRIDHFKNVYSSEIDTHYKRWGFEDWDSHVEELYEFAQQRPEIFRAHMQAFFELGEEYRLDLDVSNGTVFINGLEISEYPYTGTYFSGSPLTLEVRPVSRDGTVRWSDGNTETRRVISPEESISLSVDCN